MDEQNPWWHSEKDRCYEEWERSEIKWVPSMIDKIDLRPYSLHFIYGPRQVGKTTALKLLVQRELRNRSPESIFYYSCDELIDHEELGELLDDYYSMRNARQIKSSLILLDEVTMVKEWWRAVKFRIDQGEFLKDTVIITGSASLELSKQRERFPGRRGHGADHLMLPLSFSEMAKVLGKLEVRTGGIETISQNKDANIVHRARLSRLFDSYFESGGFPASVKEHATTGKVSSDTKRIYLDWARGDWARAGRSDAYMKEVLAYILRTRGTPISWNNLSQETSINSPHTARAYVETLEGLFIAIVLPLLCQDGKVEHKKNKKVHFIDPLLYRIFSNYTKCEVLEETIFEATIAAQVARMATPYYYSNGKMEVDVVSRIKDKTYGFEATVSARKKVKKPAHMQELFLLNKETAPVILAGFESV